MAVYCVSGNHDNPARDDTNYRLFERKVNNEYPSLIDDCGAFYKCINEHIDLIGLNPTYCQNAILLSRQGSSVGIFTTKSQQKLLYYHIIMCHPPLILHNPQRTADMTPYIVAEQDKRFQGILDMNRNVILVSGAYPSLSYCRV